VNRAGLAPTLVLSVRLLNLNSRREFGQPGTLSFREGRVTLIDATGIPKLSGLADAHSAWSAALFMRITLVSGMNLDGLAQAFVEDGWIRAGCSVLEASLVCCKVRKA
jgi:hypothetical protein